MYVIEWGDVECLDSHTTAEEHRDGPGKPLGRHEIPADNLSAALTEFFKREDNPRYDWVTLTCDKTR